MFLRKVQLSSFLFSVFFQLLYQKQRKKEGDFDFWTCPKRLLQNGIDLIVNLGL